MYFCHQTTSFIPEQISAFSDKLSSKQIQQLQQLQQLQNPQKPDKTNSSKYIKSSSLSSKQLLPTLDPTGVRPMFSGYTSNCNRPQLRTLQSSGFFNDVEKLNPLPTHISLIEGNQVKLTNLTSSVTESDLYSILTKIGPIKSLKIRTEKGDTSCALVSMVRRLDSKKIAQEYNEQYLMGTTLKVEEIRPGRNVKYMKQGKFEWKQAFPHLYTKSLDCEVEDLDIVTCHRGLFPKDFPTPHRVKFTVRVSFKE